ncbi:hypothetical protein [Amycolatopsis sp. FDAARGOS 1241]|uniref:hypothetical protein n=1 Tax=Amycolatopsis sp. FDAARGOS 1241 TaxID=2778070 RepID=UPI00194E88F5|nr:hypothetical protein [Amycolatopsis sp. FDAARGOS 1241]QRP45674.1 hypothetical protein I6J71_42345 [Amycolatopsis sp. FDAARGOS 1241]
MRKVVLGAALLVALAACSSGTDGAGAKAAGPEALGPDGLRGLTLGVTKASTGAKLAAQPMSGLDGCLSYAFAGGLAPDPAALEAEQVAVAKADDLNRKAQDADSKILDPGLHGTAEDYAKSAAESAAAAKLSAQAASAITAVAELREARAAELAATGGAVFRGDKLRAIVAPPQVKTPEGVGAGTPLAEVHRLYDAKGLKPTPAGHFAVPVPGHPGWAYDFTADGPHVTYVVLVDPALECRA